MRKLILLLVLLTGAGCVSPEERARRAAVAEQERVEAVAEQARVDKANAELLARWVIQKTAQTKVSRIICDNKMSHLISVTTKVTAGEDITCTSQRDGKGCIIKAYDMVSNGEFDTVYCTLSGELKSKRRMTEEAQVVAENRSAAAKEQEASAIRAEAKAIEREASAVEDQNTMDIIDIFL